VGNRPPGAFSRTRCLSTVRLRYGEKARISDRSPLDNSPFSRGVARLISKVSEMLETIQAISLLTLMEEVGPVLLGATLAYGILMSRRRSRAAKQRVG